MVPVLVGLRVEDDVAIARRKGPEAAVVTPVLPHLHGVAGSGAYSFAEDAPSILPGSVPPFFPRKRPVTRYQNLWRATPTAAATPMTADTSMLPVPGSR